MKMTIERKTFPLVRPFVITGYVFEAVDTVRVTLEENGHVGRGEGVGVYYLDDTVDEMVQQLDGVRSQVETGLTGALIQDLLPPGGARNALDCAFWDLGAKRQFRPIWSQLHLNAKQLVSVATVGIASPEDMAEAARRLGKYPNIKIKLSGEDPIARLEAIRASRPDAKLIIDVNQGWSFDELKEYIPACQRLGIDMIEQPLARGSDEELEGFKSPVPIGADESCLSVAEYETAARRYDVINIKLDKCGGLTEALEIVELAQRDSKALMIGNMTGSSLSMAPAYVIGQFCQFVDIDGPVFIKNDIENGLQYGDGGIVSMPIPALWG